MSCKIFRGGRCPLYSGMKLGWADGGLVLEFALQSTCGVGSLGTEGSTLGIALRVDFNLDGETCLTKEPASRAEPSFGCFSITIILPGLLPICTRSESLFVFLVRTFVVNFDAFLADRLLPDPLAFARRFLPALTGLLLVSILLVCSTGCTDSCGEELVWQYGITWTCSGKAVKTLLSRGHWMAYTPSLEQGIMEANFL